MASRFYRQYSYNVGEGPEHCGENALPALPPARWPVRLIAYYLPQFHAIPENDRWWGAGFTEWTNVTKAVPRYVGHRQPLLPADLGFYDLGRGTDVIRRQAALARRAGIEGFCIHNYWFSGQRLLERPLDNLLADRSVDLPFCLNWANENWSRRWDGLESHLLMEQRYDPGDLVGYVRSILPALRDPRYMRVGGRPIVMVYRPALIPQAAETFAAWRSFLISENVGDPYLIMPQVFHDDDPRAYGMDAAAGFPPHNGAWDWANDRASMTLIDPAFRGHVRDYADIARHMQGKRGDGYTLHPGVMPAWDNEARKPGAGLSFHSATAERYRAWLRVAAQTAQQHALPDERMVFLNAWNEWAEGAVLEPDRHMGYAYLVATRSVIDELAGEPVAALRADPARLDPACVARPGRINRLVNTGRAVLHRIRSRPPHG